jgi:hypothetical protein
MRSRLARGGVAYLLAAGALTASWAALSSWAAPETGLVRSMYAGTDFGGEPLSREAAPDVSLDFLADRADAPTRFFSVRWHGYWFLPSRQTVELHAGADDRIGVWIDGTLVRSPGEGMRTSVKSLALEAGSHELTVEYVQRGGGSSVHFQRTTAGGTPGPFPPHELFRRQVGSREYWTARGLGWMRQGVTALWLLPPAGLVLWLGWRCSRALQRAAPAAMRRWRSVGAPRSWRDFAGRVRPVAFSALLGPFVLCLLGPHTIYAANRREFGVPLGELAPWLLAVAALCAVLLLAAGALLALLSERLARACAALLFGLGILLWIQGNVLVSDYGLLNGETLDLSLHAWRMPFEVGVWTGAIALAVFLARQVAVVAPLATTVFLGLQAILLLAPLASPTPADEVDVPRWSQPPEGIFELSRTKNVIHIVLDGFPSEVFASLMEEEGPFLDAAFDGFVFFRDHLGAFPTTRASMPAMLTGAAYRNETPFDVFEDTASEHSVFAAFSRNGYGVHSITFHSIEHPPASLPGAEPVVRFTIPTPYGTRADYVAFTTAQLLDLSLFRHLPHGLKSWIYNEEAWLVQRWFSASGQAVHNARPSNHVAFLEDFADRVTVTQDWPVYKFIHVAVPHPPIVLDADCSFLGPTRLNWHSYASQARCGLQSVRRLLDRLKALSVYDDSLVLLTADHGWRVTRGDGPLKGVTSPAGSLDGIAPSAMPLLAIKPPGSSGPVRTSLAPTSITDIPATLLDLMGLPVDGLPGEPVFRLDPARRRQRTYAHHSWTNAGWRKPYFDLLHVFSINGPTLDPDSWTFEEAISEPSDDLERQLEESGSGLPEPEQGADGPFRGSSW